MNKRTIFEYFKNLGFVTSSFSAYDRINPSYNFNKGVDIFKYSKNHTAEEIIEDIIGQIEMFKNNSNFIYAHILIHIALLKIFIGFLNLLDIHLQIIISIKKIKI